MQPTPRDWQICQALFRYKFLLTSQIRDVVLAHDADCSITRRRLRRMEYGKLVRRRGAELGNTPNITTAPIWTLTEHGACRLGTETGDERYFTFQEPKSPWINLTHNVRCSQVAILMDQALVKQDRLRITALYFESDVIRVEANSTSQRCKLFTEIETASKKVVCAPDFGFEIEAGTQRRGYLCELETGSDGSPARIAARKSPGIAALAATQKWKEIFPQATSFAALMFVPHAGWRNALRKAMQDKPGAELWRFAAVNELTADNFFSSPVFYTVNEGPRSFVGGIGSQVPEAVPVCPSSLGPGNGQSGR